MILRVSFEKVKLVRGRKRLVNILTKGIPNTPDSFFLSLSLFV